jgi:hypothetical protein
MINCKVKIMIFLFFSGKRQKKKLSSALSPADDDSSTWLHNRNDDPFTTTCVPANVETEDNTFPDCADSRECVNDLKADSEGVNFLIELDDSNDDDMNKSGDKAYKDSRPVGKEGGYDSVWDNGSVDVAGSLGTADSTTGTAGTVCENENVIEQNEEQGSSVKRKCSRIKPLIDEDVENDKSDDDFLPNVL